MDKKRFWEIVATIGWQDHACDVGVCKRIAKRELPTQELMEEFREVMGKLQNALCGAIDSWETDTGSNLPVSDDGYSDLTCHIIGLGEAVYLAERKDPALAFKRATDRSYVESFSYTIPYEWDYKNHADLMHDRAVTRMRDKLEKQIVDQVEGAVEPIIEAALSELPPDSISYHIIKRAVETGILRLCQKLEDMEHTAEDKENPDEED